MKKLNVILLGGIVGFLFIVVPPVNAAVAVSNASFENECDQCWPDAAFYIPCNWTPEDLSVYGGIQNSTVNIFQFSEIGAAPINGNNYLRIAHDLNEAADGPGGVWQEVGTMVEGETYAFSIDAYTRDDMGGVDLDYYIAMEMYSGSYDPCDLSNNNQIARETITLDSTSGIGVLNTGVLSAMGQGANGQNLTLRIAVADPDMWGAMRGGLDNIQFEVKYLAYAPDPANMAVSVALDKTLSWSTSRDPGNPGDPDPLVDKHAVYLGRYDPNGYTLEFQAYVDAGSPVEETAVFDPPDDFLTDSKYYWRVDEVLTGGGGTKTGIVWSFDTPRTLPTFVEPFIQDARVFPGETATFTVNVDSSTPVNYQWYKYVDGENDTKVGTDADTLSITDAQLADEGLYYCEATNQAVGGIVDSDMARLIIKQIVGHWTFDDTLDDSSVKANHGVFRQDPNQSVPPSGTPVYGSAIIGTGAIELDGIDDYVEIPNESDYDLYDAVSLSCWMKSNDVGSSGAANGLVGKWGIEGKSYLLYQAGNGVPVLIRRISVGDLFLAADANSTDNEWHYVVGTYKLSSGLQRIYVDGELRAESVTTQAAATVETDVPVVIGATINTEEKTQQYYFKGLIDDVRIYNYELDYLDDIASRYYTITSNRPCITPLQYDFNQNCIVDLSDFVIFAEDWLDTKLYPDCYPDNCF